ncbi:unnamed protein product [Boreogadus saida]
MARLAAATVIPGAVWYATLCMWETGSIHLRTSTEDVVHQPSLSLDLTLESSIGAIGCQRDTSALTRGAIRVPGFIVYHLQHAAVC